MIFSDSSTYISDMLIDWYNANKRDLPWRDITDPYKIWISEIILQQTRVNQGISYFLRFIDRFPTVEKLAEAEEDEVLKYWQGLGYYSRARNLHKAAQQIIINFDGVFPAEHNNVLQLAGVGDYTAAAICSFAYNKPYAVVDGNVYRVLSRIFGIETPIDSGLGKKEFAGIAHELLSKSEPGIHNQAIMEFGALQCMPTSPDCTNCSLQNNCKAFEFNLITKLPVKSNKTKVLLRYFNYIYIEYQGCTYLQKRTNKDVWQNLYEFPLIESDCLLSSTEFFENEVFKDLFNEINEVEIREISTPIKHILTHRVIFAQFVMIKLSNENEALRKLIKVPIEDIDRYAVSRLIELFLERRKIEK
jgi:A/G-specific adenine glycosylase